MEEIECSFTSGNKWFRLRARGNLINDGKVLMIRNERDPYYYSVGGGVKHNETTETAVIREVWEETRFKFEIDRLVFIHENLFSGAPNNTLSGLQCHELAFYYQMKWEPTSQVKDNGFTYNGSPEHLVWLDIDNLSNSDLIVYPSFFLEELNELGFSPKHIITIE